MAHTILTFITKVDPDKLGRLEVLLDQIESDRERNPHIPFGSLKLLHFASLVIFDDEVYGPCLVFENNFDGSLDSYLNDLLRHAAVGIHEVYSCCVGYAADGTHDHDRMVAYLRAHLVRPNTFHIGNVGRTAERIKREAALRCRIEGLLDKLVTAGATSVQPDSLRQRIQQFVKGVPEFGWTYDTPPRQTTLERFMPRAKIAFVGLCALVLLPVLLPVAVVWMIILRRHEKHDPNQFRPVSPAHVRRLAEREDRVVQNHLASITRVKPGWFRRTTLRLVLWVANLLARISTKGELSGIPSIHFAHWSLIDDGRRLLFLSNYDGSWGSYLDDFIDKASTGLTGIWSNTTDFPPARFLVLDGARDGPRFKSVARASQTSARVWYSAYPELSVQNIDNNSAIREDLFTTLDEAGVRDWLRRF